MSRFADTLRRAREQLEVPEPARSRILLEMAADLEDSYQAYREQGCGEAEAARRAEEAFSTSTEALEQLARLHRLQEASRDRAGDRLSGQVGRWWERLLLVLIVVFEVAVALKIVLDEGFFLFLSPFVWPIVALALAAFVVTLWKLRQIFARAGVDVRRLRRGLGTLLFFSAGSLGLAICGFLFDLKEFFRVSADEAPEALFYNFAGWTLRISSLMTIGLVVAFLTALVWFVLTNLIARGEAREIEALLTAEAS